MNPNIALLVDSYLTCADGHDGRNHSTPRCTPTNLVASQQRDWKPGPPSQCCSSSSFLLQQLSRRAHILLPWLPPLSDQFACSRCPIEHINVLFRTCRTKKLKNVQGERTRTSWDNCTARLLEWFPYRVTSSISIYRVSNMRGIDNLTYVRLIVRGKSAIPQIVLFEQNSSSFPGFFVQFLLASSTRNFAWF